MENGKFKVSIPVNSSLNGKEITVYYMNSENKLEEYETVVENNIATFETNHFSTYILAEKANASNETNTSESTNTNVENENTTNPPTSDNILVYYIALIVSAMLLTVACVNNRSLNNK